MKKTFFLLFAILGVQLSACTSNVIAPTQNVIQKPEETVALGSKSIGGSLENSMDENDKAKLSQALDKGLGKTTEWVSTRNGIRYSVTPLKKITYANNPYCRRYQITAVHNGKERTLNGTACVSPEDSSWRVVN